MRINANSMVFKIHVVNYPHQRFQVLYIYRVPHFQALTQQVNLSEVWDDEQSIQLFVFFVQLFDHTRKGYDLLLEVGFFVQGLS